MLTLTVLHVTNLTKDGKKIEDAKHLDIQKAGKILVRDRLCQTVKHHTMLQ